MVPPTEVAASSADDQHKWCVFGETQGELRTVSYHSKGNDGGRGEGVTDI